MSLEVNKRIAEFMGYKFNENPDLTHNNITKPNEDEWYFASWDLEEFNNHIKSRYSQSSRMKYLNISESK